MFCVATILVRGVAEALVRVCRLFGGCWESAIAGQYDRELPFCFEI